MQDAGVNALQEGFSRPSRAGSQDLSMNRLIELSGAVISSLHQVLDQG